MTLQELSLLKSFLEIKINKLNESKDSTDPNSYSELNLSKLMLKYIQSQVQQDADACVRYTQVNSSPNKYYNYYTTDLTFPSENISEKICDKCKFKNPSHTRCIHV